ELRAHPGPCRPLPITLRAAHPPGRRGPLDRAVPLDLVRRQPHEADLIPVRSLEAIGDRTAPPRDAEAHGGALSPVQDGELRIVQHLEKLDGLRSTRRR